MFDQDADWSDDGVSQTTSKTTPEGSQKKNSTTKLKSKPVGKKSLMRTLQTLGSVPEWKNEDHQEGSDSEVEAAPSSSKRKKKKRVKKRRRHAETSGEQEEDGDAEESVQEKPAPKKKKKESKPGPPKTKSASAVKVEDKEITGSNQLDANKPEKADGLTRQQWKNKMKNKRKCKNRYRHDKPEEGAISAADNQELKEEVKMDSDCRNSNEKSIQQTSQKKEKKLKPQKKEKATEKSKKQLIVNSERTKSGKVEKSSSEPAVNGSKQKPDESKMEIANDHQQISTNKPKVQLSKEQNLKREKLRKLLQVQAPVQQESPTERRDEPKEQEEAEEQEVKPSEASSSSFRARMEQRLESARFRYINEVLYSTSSGEAKRMFKQDPQAFWVYHKGYTAQVQRWPANPVDGIISFIHKRPSSLVVADFGCGDCKIARSVKNKVHSFDLAATCELVTVCDMAHVPLKDGSVDIAVFCLSLMGTNLADFLSEANRVLKNGGILKIAEVASRFDNVRNFLTTLARLGFKMVSKDTENTHFYSFEFEKTGKAPESGKKLGLQLKPCLYKKR